MTFIIKYAAKMFICKCCCPSNSKQGTRKWFCMLPSPRRVSFLFVKLEKRQQFCCNFWANFSTHTTISFYFSVSPSISGGSPTRTLHQYFPFPLSSFKTHCGPPVKNFVHVCCILEHVVSWTHEKREKSFHFYFSWAKTQRFGWPQWCHIGHWHHPDF